MPVFKILSVGLIALLVGVLAETAPALAVPVQDQFNPEIDPSYGFCEIGNSLCGESFQTNQTNIDGAGVFITPDWTEPTPGNLTISIYSSYSSIPSGLIATGTVSGITSNSGWVDVFWNAVAVNPDTTYYMVLASSQTGLVAAYSAGYNNYPNGASLYGGNVEASDFVDLAFRTYSDNAYQPTGVPAPAALALLGLGLLGLGGLRRKAA